MKWQNQLNFGKEIAGLSVQPENGQLDRFQILLSTIKFHSTVFMVVGSLWQKEKENAQPCKEGNVVGGSSLIASEWTLTKNPFTCILAAST